tara:strand:- start:3507 stop:4115 length:609 start_codon:yes stop_codon:yes gene_type:complete
MNKNKKRVFSYFQSKAKNYNSNSTSFPWSIIRKFESKIVLDFIGKVRGIEVLDVGSGSGFYSTLILENKAKKLYAVDNSKEMLKNIENHKIIKINSNAESFKIKKKFKKIICAGLLEFTNSPKKILKNIKNHSNRNTRLIVLLPMNNIFGIFYKLFHLSNGLNIKIFKENEINEIFTKSYWKIENRKNFLFSAICLLKIDHE